VPNFASRRGTSCTYADGVAFPEDVLADEEEIVLHLRPHWKAAVAPIVVYHGGRYGAYPWLAWRCTEYVLTGERLLMQWGVVDRQRRDLPLNRVNDHSMTQSLLDRVLGSGTLTLDSIGDQRAVMAGVPAAQLVQSTLYELIELAPADEEDEEETPQRGSSSGRSSR
jgi:hypothetical protein